MNQCTLIAIGNFPIKRKGVVRSSQYRCNGPCQQVFEIEGVHAELKGKEATEFLNRLSGKRGRKCKCEKEASNNVVPVQHTASDDDGFEAPVTPKIDLLATPASAWTVDAVQEHLKYHQKNHKLGDPVTIQAIPQGQYANPKISCVFQHPPGVYSKELELNCTLLVGHASPHLKARICDSIDEAKADRVYEAWVDEIMKPVRAKQEAERKEQWLKDRGRERAVRKCVQGAISNILLEARKNAPAKPGKTIRKPFKTVRQLALKRAIDAYQASDTHTQAADEMMKAALLFV